MDIENLINGVNFKKISNVIIDLDVLVNDISFESKNIIFCKTDMLSILFKKLENSNSKNILITHQSDFEINSELFSNKPESIIKWYAQNVNHKDENLIPLPIGIENHTGPSKGTLIDLNFIKEYQQDYTNKEKITNKIYCNFNLETYFYRRTVKDILLQNELAFFDQFNIPSKEFHNNLSKYLFVASPRGNGIDCHRTWESLLMGSVPIVEKHFMYDTYKNLPIIQIQDWTDLSKEGFFNEYIHKYYNNQLFQNMEELTMDFWFNKILKVFEEI